MGDRAVHHKGDGLDHRPIMTSVISPQNQREECGGAGVRISLRLNHRFYLRAKALCLFTPTVVNKIVWLLGRFENPGMALKMR